MAHYAAVDIGASSGRVVVGFVEDGRIHLEEVHRFDNRQVRRGGHDCWDIDLLYGELVRGLALCKEAGFAPKSVGIDTWGVDFVLLDADDNLVGDAVAYRDERTQGMFEVADALPPHGHPAPALQHHLSVPGPAAREPRTAGSG